MADLTTTAWKRFPKNPDPRDKVSKNFAFSELTASEIAARQGIDNGFRTVNQLRSAVYLCREILQPVRDRFGKFSPNSVYRCQALERALKKKPKSWTSRSQHTRGQACDIEIPGVTTLRLAEWVEENLEFDQLILECYNPALGPNSGWVHVSLKPPGAGNNRRSVRSYVHDPEARKFVYVPGLRESAMA